MSLILLFLCNFTTCLWARLFYVLLSSLLGSFESSVNWQRPKKDLLGNCPLLRLSSPLVSVMNPSQEQRWRCVVPCFGLLPSLPRDSPSPLTRCMALQAFRTNWSSSNMKVCLLISFTWGVGYAQICPLPDPRLSGNLAVGFLGSRRTCSTFQSLKKALRQRDRVRSLHLCVVGRLPQPWSNPIPPPTLERIVSSPNYLTNLTQTS